MPIASLFCLIFPVLGGAALLLLNPGEGSRLTTGYLPWFVAGAVLQVGAGLLLYGRTRARWGWGWTALWAACAGYMGGYAGLYLQEKGLGEITPADGLAAAALKEDGLTVLYLQYVFTLLFLTAFYAIAAFSRRDAQKAYDMVEPDLEDPLDFEREGATG